MAAVLLVFQYGQPRIFFAMARDGLLPRWAAKLSGKARVPYATTLLTGVFVALWSLIGDAGETYDLTNIGTLFAFALVCIGVIVLRYTDPERPRPFRVPLVHGVGIIGAALCVFVMKGLPQFRLDAVRNLALARTCALFPLRLPQLDVASGDRAGRAESTGPILQTSFRCRH